MTGNKLCFLVAVVLFAVAAVLDLTGTHSGFPWVPTGLAFGFAGFLVG